MAGRCGPDQVAASHQHSDAGGVGRCQYDLYQSRISRAERLFNYDVIDSHAVGCNSNKQNDPIDDALRGHHALAALPAGI